MRRIHCLAFVWLARCRIWMLLGSVRSWQTPIINIARKSNVGKWRQDSSIPSTPQNSQIPDHEWDVYVCQSKSCKERGSGATLGAFVGLAPPDAVKVHGAVFAKSKGKGPNVRCVQRSSEKKFEVNNVDSVDKVYRILTHHMHIQGIDAAACECLKWNYKGNGHLDRNEINQAISCYDAAISTNYTDQLGVVLVMRSTAYLQRAFQHRNQLKTLVEDLSESVLDPDSLRNIFDMAVSNPRIALGVLNQLIEECRAQDLQFQKIKYRRGLYENALLHAARDALYASQLLPEYAKTWLRVGDSMAELRRFEESAEYYQKAMELDESLKETLEPLVERLRSSQRFLEEAKMNGWSEDILRLGLDVAG